MTSRLAAAALGPSLCFLSRTPLTCYSGHFTSLLQITSVASYCLQVLQPSNQGLEEGWANYSPQAKFGPLSVFVNKVELEHSHTITDILSVAAFPLQWQS